MKLTLSNHEACTLIAAKHNLFVEEVEVLSPMAPPPAPVSTVVKPNIYSTEAINALLAIWDEAYAQAERNLGEKVGYPNKIAIIKAVRALTQANLKDAKDFTEEQLLKERLPF